MLIGKVTVESDEGKQRTALAFDGGEQAAPAGRHIAKIATTKAGRTNVRFILPGTPR
jgi:hypothetical protein